MAPRPEPSHHHPLSTPLLIQAAQSYVWISAGWEKLESGTFPSGMAKTLETFAGKNPHGWYVQSVISLAQRSPEVFGNLVQWGELLAGTGLLVGALLFFFGKQRSYKILADIVSVASLLAVLFMSANFYFAAGWMSPSTASLCSYLFWTGLILLGGWSMAITMAFKKTK